jgi:3-deoxy-D-manno-octulosonic-acid transferase
MYLAQSKENADRLVRIGAPTDRVQVAGNLKYDVRTVVANTLTESLRANLPSGAPVVVCGSTLEGEERMLLDAWPAVLEAEPRAVMVLAPRHPDRFGAVAALVAERGSPVQRASTFREQPKPVLPGSVFLLDTIGDLASIYSLGTLAFVGGSLIPSGGHNPLEPAQFGVPLLVGPSFQNFREIVDAMQASNAIRVVSPENLAATIAEMLRHTSETQKLGERGRVVFESQSGATKRTVAALLKLLVRERGE